MVEMLADLRDSESKLKVLLRGMDQVDAKIDKLLNGASQVFTTSVTIIWWLDVKKLTHVKVFLRYHMCKK